MKSPQPAAGRGHPGANLHKPEISIYKNTHGCKNSKTMRLMSKKKRLCLFSLFYTLPCLYTTELAIATDSASSCLVNAIFVRAHFASSNQFSETKTVPTSCARITRAVSTSNQSCMKGGLGRSLRSAHRRKDRQRSVCGSNNSNPVFANIR